MAIMLFLMLICQASNATLPTQGKHMWSIEKLNNTSSIYQFLLNENVYYKNNNSLSVLLVAAQKISISQFGSLTVNYIEVIEEYRTTFRGKLVIVFYILVWKLIELLLFCL